MTKTNLLKVAGVTVTALLLIGATGCNNTQTSQPATDTNTAPETSTPTQTTVTVSPEATTGTQVLVTDNGFDPKSVTIKVGETVTWTNNSASSVRVASEPHPLHTGYPGFDDLSGAAKGDTYPFTFTKKGTFGYHNHNNPSMKGTVVVE